MTLFIAMLAGPYFLVTGIGLLASTSFYEKMTAEAQDTDRVALNLSGAYHFLVGLAILVQHFRWDGVAAGLVTLIGLAALLKGAALIAVPELTLRSSKMSRPALKLSGCAFILIGGYLGTVGFTPLMPMSL